MSGMKVDEGDARSLEPVIARVDRMCFQGCQVVGALRDVHVPQYRTYPRATGKPLCLLIKFGQPKIEIRRIAAQP
jgi:hypothetical protein